MFRQEGEDPEQVKFRDALMRLREYKSSQEDHALFSERFWDRLSPEEREGYKNTLHLLPTKEAVKQLNTQRLAALGKPVVLCKARHNGTEAKKASEEDAEGLQKEVLLAEGARVMITRNVWTSKGSWLWFPLIFMLTKYRVGKWGTRHRQENLVSARLKFPNEPSFCGVC